MYKKNCLSKIFNLIRYANVNNLSIMKDLNHKYSIIKIKIKHYSNEDYKGKV